MENAGTVPNQVNVFIIGDIGDLVKVQPDSLTIEPGETKEVNFRLTMPASAPVDKKYSGKVFVLRLPLRLW